MRIFVTKRQWREILQGNIQNISVFKETELHYHFGDYPEKEVQEIRIKSKGVGIIIEEA